MNRAMQYALGVTLFLSPLATAQTTQPAGEERTLPSGLKIVDVLKLNEPLVAQVGDTVIVHYTGTLANGAKFDSSLDRKDPFGNAMPFQFVLGANSVIKGWEEGILGMKAGEKRKLIIPPALGYGAEGRPPRIPGNSTLIFDVELIGIQRPQK